MDFPKLFNLSGNVAIVTGSGRGLGESMAFGLAKADADAVVIVDIEKELAAETAKKIEDNIGVGTLSMEVDVACKEDVNKMVERTLNKFGHIDILVNNAGINIKKPISEMTVDDWSEVMDVNVTGMFLCSKMVGKEMVEAERGKIINIASIYGKVGSFLHDAIAYNTSKGAVINFTRSLAVEWGEHNINVNAIGPANILTDMTRSQLKNQQYYNAVMERTPLKRLGRPQDVVGSVIFLASQASEMVTGQVLYVDGGWIAS